TVVGSMIYKFDPGYDIRYSVPIGRPVANTQVYILNNHYQPVPMGVVGELYIGGSGLAQGYLYNPGLTEEKFVPNPFIPGQRIYKTGDLAVRLADGNIEYKGRIDHQVKIRGHRVETGEIEAKIVEFQKMSRAGREQKENIVEKINLKSLVYCKTCLIPANYPGGIKFDEHGICEICREFETYKDKALDYFKTMPDFHQVVARAQKKKKSKYDCLLLYSGGKDSSYTLHRLVDMGLKVLAFTFDNDYISAKAFENIDRTIKLLNIDHIILNSQAMKEIFVESLWSDYNVCNGCFKAVNTLGTKIAHDHQINLVISGLTRGQIFDIKLHGLFKLGIFDEETIEERLNLFRKNYHSMTHRTSRLIGVEISNETLDNTYFVDYFRYDKTTTENIFEYLKEKDKGWVRPTDTGASSSNCIINDIGIYVHLKDKGCHFYAPQLSWDCRFGTISREEGLEEMWGYQVDYPMTRRVLDEIGYYNAFTGAVVTEVKDDRGEKVLCAYILADKELEVTELKNYLARELPDYMIPTYFTRIDRIPLTSSGKIDRKALPKPELTFKEEYAAPRNPIEEKLVSVWSELLGIKKEKIGIDVNFFEVGGHSLRATFLAASINKEFNVKVPLVKIFEAPTIRGLAQYIMEEAEENIFISITPAKVKEYYALSSAQTRLYILQQMESNSTAYNVPNIIELEGELEKEKFEETFRNLIARHESLRTSFEMVGDRFVQKVHPASEIQFKIKYDELEIRAESQKQIIDKKIRAFVKPFELSQAPLLRVELLRIEPLKHILMVDMHHILTDGISYQIFVKDFLSFYWGQELPPLLIQYKDYSEWQQSTTGQEIFKRQEEYWLRQFEGEIPELNLPTDYPRPAVQNFEGDSSEFEIEEEESKILNSLALSEGATLFMVLLAVYNILLSKLSSQEDIVVGVPIAARIHADLENVIGIFINMLAIRNFPGQDLTFSEFLKNLRLKSLEAFENQEYSFEDFVEKANVERNVSRNPLFDVLFALQNMSPAPDSVKIAAQEKKGLQVKPFNFENKTSKYDLSLLAIEKDRKLFFSMEYCTKLFNKESILRFINYFKKIITVIAENPQVRISEIEVLSENEKKHLLYDFNDTGIEYPKDKVIHQLFEEQVNKTPNRIAIVFEDRAMTYYELEKQANWVANYLFYNKNIQIEERVGILMDRSMNIIIAMLGILKAGGAYVPIDSSLPAARIKYIIDNAEINGIIFEKHNLEKANDLQSDGKKFHAFLCLNEQDNLANRNYDSLILEEDQRAHADNLAYVIYTSGTTGMPKGIMIQHRSVSNFITGITHVIDFNEYDYVLSLTTISFDIFGLETLVPITRGARTVIGNNNEQLNNIALINVLIKQKISILQVTPARLQFLFSADLSSTMLDKLKYLLVGGEAFPEALLKKARILIPGKIYNLYGPTETTIWSTIKDVTGENSLNIGKPIANTKIYILNENKNLLPIGVRGILYIGGDGLARGYLNNDKLTKEKFINNPFFAGQKIYNTGDLARWLPDGNLEFLGRMDQQVKIRGFRIELGEIEYQLSKINGINESVVIDKTAENGDKYLCAYIVSNKEIVVSEIRNILSDTLPDYMIPSYFIPIEKIPLTPSNKIDRKKLPVPTIQSRENNIAPR
ncbi:MAG TPA: amino acid adenylation domain-containing protein, partial [Candidatus Kapabacteria bacterium]|nr:amino acid adenylation domain-containing protein [Candidatus Kapabacteria bacterium]